MIEAYMALHEDGYAHSLEVWENGNLIGGLYGLSLGAIFFGESMFSLKSGASRAGFLRLGSFLFGNGFLCIDSQVRTDDIAGMGGREIPRTQYLGILKSALAYPDRIGDWGSLFPTFDASGSVLGVENFHDMA
ncbi:MAG: leucyl/phenylalanyl-tRNA--protein transferase [Spirochaetes bacterium]|nr:MAG: leucyl/phenylalanyl-tRNA--protein transferase [Spirochaetota bacterium]